MFLGKLYCLERKHEEAKEILEKKISDLETLILKQNELLQKLLEK